MFGLRNRSCIFWPNHWPNAENSHHSRLWEQPANTFRSDHQMTACSFIAGARVDFGTVSHCQLQRATTLVTGDKVQVNRNIPILAYYSTQFLCAGMCIFYRTCLVPKINAPLHLRQGYTEQQIWLRPPESIYQRCWRYLPSWWKRDFCSSHQ